MKNTVSYQWQWFDEDEAWWCDLYGEYFTELRAREAFERWGVGDMGVRLVRITVTHEVVRQPDCEQVD